MRSTRAWFTVAATIAFLAGMATPATAVKLDEAEIFIEINDTDGDAGIQIFLDGRGWKVMKVLDPFRERILVVGARGSVRIQGVTELFLESAEPSFDVQPLAEFLALFPEGIYRFRGKTTGGRRLTGHAILTHALPDAPTQLFPVDEAVDPADAEFVWTLVSDPPGSEIVGYHVVVECEEPELNIFTADLGPTVDSVTVPPEFLEGEECKWEVLAIEESGNRTISEAEFEID